MLYQSVALRQTTRRSGFSAGEGAAGEGAAANGSLTERRSSSYTRQSANYVDGGETERRAQERYDGCNDARERRTGATDGSNGRLRRTAATADERLGYDGLYAPVRQEGHMH